jgi:hypothetical protein
MAPASYPWDARRLLSLPGLVNLSPKIAWENRVTRVMELMRFPAVDHGSMPPSVIAGLSDVFTASRKHYYL